MKKAVIGTLLGAVVYFVWSALSWTVIPWHNPAFKPMPNESLVTDTMKTVLKEPGMYCFPNVLDANGKKDEKASMEKAKQGPCGFLIFEPVGQMMGPSLFVKAFIGDLVMAALLMWILWASRLTKLVHQLHLAAAVGLIAALAVHLPQGLFMGFPRILTVVGFLELTIGFVLMGAVMARFVPVSASRA